jgi:hypothetical protein
MPTVNEIIGYAKIAEYLSLNDKSRAGLYFDGNPDRLPELIYLVRKGVELRNQQDPTDDTLTSTANYLLTICGKYWLQSRFVSGTAGLVVVPSITPTIKSPIRITSTNFADATNWEGNNSDNIAILASYTLQVFANYVARYLDEGVEWQRTSSGVEILIPGFDAQTNDYEFYIFISVS